MSAENKQLIIWAISGFLTSFGMSIGGMAHKSSLSFFDPMNYGNFASRFTPSMMIVFMAGLLPGLYYWNLRRLPAKPVLAEKWHISTNKVIDKWLIVGSALFALGWALGGFCPGPSVAGMITGHPTYVLFSYGMYFYKVVSGIRSPGDVAHHHHWLLTALAGFIPITFYFIGPIYFPIAHVPVKDEWPLTLSLLGGACIGICALSFAHFNGRVLGISNIWRVNVKYPLMERIPHIVFFMSFELGAVFTYTIYPQVYANPPFADRNPILILFGGALVGLGTEWANGCTSGHGVCGIARLSVRSIAAVGSFMVSLFFLVPGLNFYMMN